jgi:DNA repair protein RadA/Sms
MGKIRTVFVCNECGSPHPKWVGRCATCSAWSSLVEEAVVAGPAASSISFAAPQLISDVDPLAARPQPTRLTELDRVLGGGLVAGSVTLLGGEPGIGKSTLLTQLLAAWSGPSLYVTGEESAQQVRQRAERLGVASDRLWLLAETNLDAIVEAIASTKPTVVVIDSIQTVADASLGSAPGTVLQVKACAQRLVAEAKARGIAVVLVGHVTKEGNLAGPRVLEHMVDTVLTFEGDRHHHLRLLRAAKHRFGATGELGLFEMAESGMRGVPDASALLLADRRPGIAGSVAVATLDGHRPLMVEVQALTNPVNNPAIPPRRSAQGLDPGRLSLLLAVLDRRAGFSAVATEVYASAVGGVRLSEPGADLGVCMAVASALVDTPLPPDLVVFGEVGLAGELRMAPHAGQRLSEAGRHGFAYALVPASCTIDAPGITTLRASTLAEALGIASLYPGGARRPKPVAAAGS